MATTWWCGRHYCYSFIPLFFFGWIGCRIDCRSLSYCSPNHWLRGIRFAVKVSRLSLSRRICRGVLSVANHRLCSEENSRPVKFRTLPLINSAKSIAESPICLARRSNLRRLAKSGYQRWAVLIIELRMLVSSLCSASLASLLLPLARLPFTSQSSFAMYAYNWIGLLSRWLSLVPWWEQYRFSPCLRSRRTAP